MGTENRTKADLTRQIITLVVIIGASVVANILGMAMGETDTGNIANETFNDTVYFFPATFVFATIWPVIYLGIMGLAIHQALPSQAVNPRYRRGGYMLAINLVLNAAWVWVFGGQFFTASFIVILPIMVTGVLAYAWLGVARSPGAPGAERVLKVSVGMYTAWLTIATVANASAALAAGGWNGFGLAYETWGVIMLIVGIGLGLILYLLFRDPAFPFVYMYAYAGILVRRIGEVQAIATAAAIGAGLFLVLLLLSLIFRGKLAAGAART